MPIKQDNTKVQKPIIKEVIPYKPRQYYINDLGGKPSEDTRTSEERNRDYWSPIKGAIDRFKSSMYNETNPLVGIERTVMPVLAGASLVTMPSTVIGSLVGGEIVNNATGDFGQWLENKTGLPKEIGTYLNPGAIYGGTKGFNISKNNLLTKFIKGDADLGWSALNNKHWIFNKEARNSTNVAMASLNRIMPFLSNAEKTPARIAAYKVGRRTKGNASVSLKDIKSNEATYTGSSTPEGNNGDRDLLGMYLFKNDPLISRSPWFKRISKSFKPAKGEGFSYSQRYSELYPGIEGRRYQMQSVVKEGHPLKFDSVDDFNSYSNGIGKIQGKEGDMVIETPMGFQTFRQPGTNYVGPIDDVGGHLVKIDYNNKGKLTQVSQDMWKFNPADYAKRWSGSTKSEAVRANKQAALMDKVGTPFILQQENPIFIGNNRIWESLDRIPNIVKKRRQPSVQSGLLMMKNGGLIPKYQTGATIKDVAIGMIPIVGTYQNYKKFRDNPTWGNFGWLAASAIGDALFFTGAGAALKGIKAAKAVAKSRALLTANRYGRSQAGFQRGLEYGASKGDVKSMFKNLRNYKVTEQKQLATEAAARQQIVSGAKDIGKDLGQDAIVNTTQEIISKRKGGSLTSDGRRFKFKDSPLVRNSKALNNKRDMRKKFMKSDRPTYSNNRIRKGLNGLQFVSYQQTDTPDIKFPEMNIFSPYYMPSIISSNEESPVIEVKEEEPNNTPKEPQKPINTTQNVQLEQKPIVSDIKFKNTNQFVQTMKPIYESVLQTKGLDKKYADYLVAQAALESNWGKSQSGKNNLSGIKVMASQKGKGKGTIRKTREVINGKNVYIDDEFRNFDSLEDFANYHVNLLNNKRYQAFNGDFISNVVKGGYATDPKYKNVLTRIYNQIKS